MRPPIDYWTHSRGSMRRRVLGELSWTVRRWMFSTFLRELAPTASTRILDVGVSGDMTPRESNSFVRLYPFPARVTAVGIDDLHAVRTSLRGVTLVRADALKLPFAAGVFDIAVAGAVVEHVGGRDAQREMVRELTRVARRCFVTTPNRWFPLELHTFLPVLHYLPPRLYFRCLKRVARHTWVNERTVTLLSRGDLYRLFPPDRRPRIIRGPLGANLIAIA